MKSGSSEPWEALLLWLCWCRVFHDWSCSRLLMVFSFYGLFGQGCTMHDTIGDPLWELSPHGKLSHAQTTLSFEVKIKNGIPSWLCPFNLKNQHCLDTAMVCHSTSAWACWNYAYVELFIEYLWGVSWGSSRPWAYGGCLKAISNKNCALDVGLEWNFKHFGDAFEAFSSCAEGRLMTPIFFLG